MTSDEEKAREVCEEVTDPGSHDECGNCAIILQALREARAEGLEEGIRRYAWWKDGVQYVGSCGTTLAKAMKELKAGGK